MLADPQLLRLNFGIFALHAMLMALFVQVPFALRDAGIAAVAALDGLPAGAGRVGRLDAAAVPAASTVPAAARRCSPARSRRSSPSLLILAAARSSLATIVAGLAVFFCAFNLLEASLPSLVSRFAPRGSRGAAIGVYSEHAVPRHVRGRCERRLLLKHAGPAAVFGFGAALAALWLVAVATMANPPAAAESTLSMGRT